MALDNAPPTTAASSSSGRSDTPPRPLWFSCLRIPKNEEQKVPHFPTDADVLDNLEGILGIEDERDEASNTGDPDTINEAWLQHGNFDFACWNQFSQQPQPKGKGPEHMHSKAGQFSAVPELDEMEKSIMRIIKPENLVFPWDGNNVEEEKKTSLNLNLNHGELLEAWRSNRCTSHYGPKNNNYYMGEVPVGEETEDTPIRKDYSREASVMRYKEKRRSRLFSLSNSKKIRYQVRKLNADIRPRFKGRFVKRNSTADDMLNAAREG